MNLSVFSIRYEKMENEKTDARKDEVKKEKNRKAEVTRTRMIRIEEMMNETRTSIQIASLKCKEAAHFVRLEIENAFRFFYQI